VTKRPLTHVFALLLCLLPAALAQDDAAHALGPTVAIDAAVEGVPQGAPARVSVLSASEVVVAELTLDGGRLLGVLPDLAGDPVLEPVTSETLWPCRVDASAEARFMPVTLSAEGTRAVLELASDVLPAEPEVGYLQLVFVYADADVRIEATCPAEPQPLVVAADLRAGWNLLTSEPVLIDDILHLLLRTATEDDVDAVRWYWRSLDPVERP
jgi:hypothetical protein